MRFFAAIDALPSLESMKFPVFSLLTGNFGLFRDEFAAVCDCRAGNLGIACGTQVPVRRSPMPNYAGRRQISRGLGRRRSLRRRDQAVNVKRLPVVQSTSFSGISCFARSTKFCPLQCIGSTCPRSNFFSSAMTCRR